MRIMSQIKVGDLEAEVISVLPELNLEEFVDFPEVSEPEGPQKILVKSKNGNMQEFYKFTEFVKYINE